MQRIANLMLKSLIAMILWSVLPYAIAQIPRQVAEELLRNTAAILTPTPPDGLELHPDVTCMTGVEASAARSEEVEQCEKLSALLSPLIKRATQPAATDVLIDSFSKHFDPIHLTALQRVRSRFMGSGVSSIPLTVSIPTQPPRDEPFESHTFAQSPVRAMRIARLAALQEYSAQLSRLLIYAGLIEGLTKSPAISPKINPHMIRRAIAQAEKESQQGIADLDPWANAIVSLIVAHVDDHELALTEQFLESTAGRHFVQTLNRATHDMLDFVVMAVLQERRP